MCGNLEQVNLKVVHVVKEEQITLNWRLKMKTNIKEKVITKVKEVCKNE